ncbi:WecB/TagA/CpsF family glycosyltransferase [Microbacterium arborescens]|uniref:WecB/TagA/CpsF family glycosyltransferase n=1 Tax=Microbacterium arborescens TaxID=33883 RepID=UPI001965B4BA|nr:WecB/TagA/CpsF family glycosyltransferase [Microbacterium arborescens]
MTRAELAEAMVTDCVQARRDPTTLPKLVFSSNGQGIALAAKDDDFANAMKKADIIHADGMPVVLASRMTGAPIPERIATTDFFHDAASAATTNGLSFFILGASERQNELAVRAMMAQYPDLTIAGRHHGYFSPDEDESILHLIRESGADVLWVALGKPHQELWCARNRDRLAGIGWVKTCGGLYAFLSGDVGRAPRWMQRAGLEWLYRLQEDPKRLAARYLKTNPIAFYRLLRHTRRGTNAD